MDDKEKCICKDKENTGKQFLEGKSINFKEITLCSYCINKIDEEFGVYRD